MSIIIAWIGAMFAVMSAKCKDVPTDVFMMQGGIMSLLFGLTYCLIYPNPGAKLQMEYFGILGGMSLLSLGGVLFVRLAVMFISPILISVLRTFEIVMALVLELCIATYMFDFGQVSFWYKVSGSAVVTLSAVLMVLSDKIGGILPKSCGGSTDAKKSSTVNAKPADNC